MATSSGAAQGAPVSKERIANCLRSASVWVEELPRYADRQQQRADFWAILAGVLAALTSLAIFPVLGDSSTVLEKLTVSAVALAAAICALVPRVKNYAEFAGQGTRIEQSVRRDRWGSPRSLGRQPDRPGTGAHRRQRVRVHQGAEGYAPRPAESGEDRDRACRDGGEGRRGESEGSGSGEGIACPGSAAGRDRVDAHGARIVEGRPDRIGLGGDERW